MKYIPLDAVLAEIKKRKREAENNCGGHKSCREHECDRCQVDKYEDFEEIIRTIEAKEVDYRPIDKDFERDAVSFCIDNALNTTPRIAKTIAKHFFELGLSVNNPITAADRGTAEEIIINLKRIESDYRINLTKEIEWVRNQVKKGG